MNVGLPGTGLGGLFYLSAALCMPLVALARMVFGRRDHARWRCALRQAGLALAILASLWATAWGLAAVLPASAHHSLRTASHQTRNLLGVTPTALSVFTLGSVLLVVELLACVRLLKRHLRKIVRPASLDA